MVGGRTVTPIFFQVTGAFSLQPTHVMVQLWTPSARGGGSRGDMTRILVSVAVVAVVGCCMIAAGGSNDAAVELMGSHHLKLAMLVEKSARSADTVRLSELSRLAAAADQQATSASALKDLEAGKLKASPGSGVDAETMLANEAKKKSEELVDAVPTCPCQWAELFAAHLLHLRVKILGRRQAEGIDPARASNSPPCQRYAVG